MVAKASELVADDAQIEARPAHPWVGRGGLKLLHALELWPITVQDRVVLDVGASTGGFTQVCLARGAARVYAVDVGRAQMHPKVLADPRVVSLEGTDARDLTTALIPERPGLIVADVSFISLEKAMPAALTLAEPGADLVVLVKPQFEVGHGKVGKGGVVTDEVARAGTLEAIKAFLTASAWTVQASADSPIEGGDGNREYLLWATKP